MAVPIYKDIFYQVFKNLQWCGVPLDGSHPGIKFYICYIALLFMLAEELAFIIKKASSEDFLLVTGLIPCICIGTRCILKMAFIVQKRRTIFALSESLEKLYVEIISDKAEADAVCGEISRVKSLTKHYFVLNIILIFVYNFSSLFFTLYVYITNRVVVLILPYPVVVPFSTEVFHNWLIVYLHSITCGK